MVDKARLRDELKNTLREVLKDIPDEADRKKLQERLQEMITYAIGRVDYYERYRTTYQTIAMGLLGGSLIVISILLRGMQDYNLAAKFFILLSVLALLAGAVYILWEYSKETSPDYAYRDVADIRSWYYRYYYRGSRTSEHQVSATPTQSDQYRGDAITEWINTLPERAQDSYDYYFKEVGKVSPPRGSDERQLQAQQYFEGLNNYIRAWVPHAANLEDILLEDIEQVYILFALQSFKRSFAVRAANALKWCAGASAILLVVGLFFSMAATAPATDSPDSIIEETTESSLEPVWFGTAFPVLEICCSVMREGHRKS